jgi:hypothetical protein
MKNGNEDNPGFKSLSFYEVRQNALSVCQKAMQTKTLYRTQRSRREP